MNLLNFQPKHFEWYANERLDVIIKIMDDQIVDSHFFNQYDIAGRKIAENQYEVYLNTRFASKNSDGKFVKLLVEIGDQSDDQVKLKIEAKFRGLKFSFWSMNFIAALVTIMGLWPSNDPEHSVRLSFIFVPLMWLGLNIAIVLITRGSRNYLIKTFRRVFDVKHVKWIGTNV